MGTRHDGLLIVLTVLVFIFSVVTFFGVGAFVALTDENGGFEAILDKYRTRLTPPSWAYCIWFLVGIWQVAWVLYVLTTICRSTETGPMYRHPPVISKLFLWGFLVALLLSCVAGLLLVNDFLLLYVVSLLLLWFTLALTLVYLHLRLDEYWVLMGMRYRRDLYMLVVSAQNGVAAYATLVTIVLLLNLCPLAVAALVSALSPSGAVIAALGVLLLVMTLYFVLDVTVLDRYTRFTFVVYPLVFWFLVSVIYHQWHPRHGVVNPLTLVVAFLVLLMLLVKIAVISGRRYKNPKVLTDFNKNGEMASLGEVRPSRDRPISSPGEDLTLVRATPPRTASPSEETSLVREPYTPSSTPSYNEETPLKVSAMGETPTKEAFVSNGRTPHDETPNGKAPRSDEGDESHTQGPPRRDIPKQVEPSQMYTSNVTIMKDVYLSEQPVMNLNYHYEYSLYLGDND